MRRRPLVIAVALLALLLLAVLLYRQLREEPVPVPPASPAPTTPAPTTPASPSPAPEAPEPTEAAPVVLIAAGDIARCDDDGEPGEGAVATGALIEELLDGEDRETLIAALGDLAYNDGTEEEFERCYDPTWGSFADITRPALGNHDDNTDGGRPYFEYFEHVDMPEPEGWYDYRFGAWHVFVLNTNCGAVGGCEEGDEQYEWLEERLAEVDTGNILAYWHNPRFSAGEHGHFDRIEDAYELLADAGADLILAGHDHDYQRWAPMRADGTPDDDAPRQLVVGTGGGELRPVEHDEDDLRDLPALEYYQGEQHGVLRVVLEGCGFSWEYITVDGDVLDEGADEGTCEG